MTVRDPSRALLPRTVTVAAIALLALVLGSVGTAFAEEDATPELVQDRSTPTRPPRGTALPASQYQSPTPTITLTPTITRTFTLSPTETLVPTATATATIQPTATAALEQALTPASSGRLTSPNSWLITETPGTRSGLAGDLGTPDTAGSVSAFTLPWMTQTATRTTTTTPTRARDIPPPPPIRYAGVPSTSTEAVWLARDSLWLGVPHRTQLDGSVWAQTNCGPTSLAMVLGSYGLNDYRLDALRGEVNRIQGDSNPDNGTSLPAIAAVGQRAGLIPLDLYGGGAGYKRWTLDDLRQHLAKGQPIITLVRYADLPGNGYYADDTNHYIVLSGFSGEHFMYNDAAFSQGRGRGLLIAPEVLKRAWDNSTIPGHAVAFALDVQGGGLLNHPRFGEVLLSEHPDEDEEDFEVEGELSALFEELQPSLAPERAPLSDGDRAPLVPSSRGAMPEPAANPETLVAAASPEASVHTPLLFGSAASVLILAFGVYAGRRRLLRVLGR